MGVCGFDFGTSNSTLGVIRGGFPALVDLENGKKPLRSAMFFNELDHSISFGEIAVENYLNHEEGRLLTSLKSVLGTSTMNASSVIFNQHKSFKEIIGFYVAHVKSIGESLVEAELSNVVVGRPVHFNDRDSKKDKAAENVLREVFVEQGFKDIEFQFEPIAAAKTFGHENTADKLAMIVDIGGGTSDFSIVRTGDDADGSSGDIVATAGIHIGGTDIDQVIALHKVMSKLGMGGTMISSSGKELPLPKSYFYDMTMWHLVSQLYSPGTVRKIKDTFRYACNMDEVTKFLQVIEKQDGHRVLASCESAKIDLVSHGEAQIDLEFVETGFSICLSHSDLKGLIIEKINSVLNEIKSMLKSVGLSGDEVDVIYYTGGTTKIDFIKNRIGALFRNARTVEGDAFGSVGTGLTYDAMEKFK
ncbi:hypothetical protein BOW53_16290 [Solemya pervernicosa gill symbiont]|uniref:Heat-shock protein n=1 Tax=Solemya pervernicosa gill symbiont TaxID=642797 RepID=A0A1T2KZE6_9GAMM|nr:Hsp70 family protein [Solemya pervernicosa gill symbiont]OOZ38201.1 hypothetical protein BOW53_16290 [Solemya pervernicosa gill symbiont]